MKNAIIDTERKPLFETQRGVILDQALMARIAAEQPPIAANVGLQVEVSLAKLRRACTDFGYNRISCNLVIVRETGQIASVTLNHPNMES
jgi:hypothetical protein